MTFLEKMYGAIGILLGSVTMAVGAMIFNPIVVIVGVITLLVGAAKIIK